MADKYDGPSVREMLDRHILALEIIARANDPHPVLDHENLAILRRFCLDPSSKHDILKEMDAVDESGNKPGTKANSKGSLAGFIVAKSAGEEDVLSEDEMDALRRWFKGRSA